MAVTKVLARAFSFSIRTATGPDVFTPIRGINSFSNDSSKNDADTTDFDSGGVTTSMAASRSYSMTLDGMRLEDVTTGARDSGQQAVETLSTQIGPASIGTFRMTTPGGKIKEFDASANVTGPGGGNDDPAAWSVELTISGAIRSIN